MTGSILMILGNGHAFCSREDYRSLLEFKWSINRSHRTAYAVARIWKDGKFLRLAMHRLIADAQDGEIIDHIDGDGLNNCRENLRKVTAQQNIWNSRARVGSSKFKGVSKSGAAWTATIKGGFLGYFSSEEAAAAAYNVEAKRLYGEFAWLNPIGSDVLPTKRKFVPAGYTYVEKINRYMASCGGKFVGYFDTPEEASVASDLAKTGVVTKTKKKVLSSRNTSGFRGVCFTRHYKTFKAYIHLNKKHKSLGSFKTAEDAARAYDAAAYAIHGKDAVLNFPNEWRGESKVVE